MTGCGARRSRRLADGRYCLAGIWGRANRTGKTCEVAWSARLLGGVPRPGVSQGGDGRVKLVNSCLTMRVRVMGRIRPPRPEAPTASRSNEQGLPAVEGLGESCWRI